MNSKKPFTVLSPAAEKLSAAESTLKYENIPGRNEWREHAETIKKFWIHPDAIGNPPGFFPTWRLNDGSIRKPGDMEFYGGDNIPGWVLDGLNYDYTRMISRQTFAYGALFNLTGDPRLLDYHRLGVKFLLEHARDPEGGFVTKFRNGKPVTEDRLHRTSQDQAYALLGLSMNSYLTGNAEIIDIICSGRKFIYDNYYDPKQNMIRWTLEDGDGEKADQQDLVAHLDQINSYLQLTWRLVPENMRQLWTDTIKLTIDGMNSRFYSAEKNTFTGCLNPSEGVDPKNDYGHKVKTFWLEYLCALSLGDGKLAEFAAKGMQETLCLALKPDGRGWYQSESGDDARWWVYAELDQSALTLALTGHFFVPETLRTLMNEHTDREYGEWKFGLKTHMWRNGFHSTEHTLIGTILSDAMRDGGKADTVLYFAPEDPASMLYTPYTYGGSVTDVRLKEKIAEVHFSDIGLPEKVV